jgi:hypothetical protein
MSSVRHGAQWASSPQSTPSPSQSRTPDLSPEPLAIPESATEFDPRSRPLGTRRRSRSSVAAALSIGLVVVLLVTVAAFTTTASAAGGYILMSRSELLARPMSGTAWGILKNVADGSLGSADACDINSDHHLRTLAAALVFARTGDAAYGAKARAGVMAGMASQKDGCDQAVLSLGRQLTGYVLAADFAGLSGADDAQFRSWLSAIRTKDIGGHSTRTSITGTHKISSNNWGAYAGASRIAADLYLGDTSDLAAAAKVTRGFLGERAQYASFVDNLQSDDLSWSCSGSAATFTPVNPPCTKNGINIDGGVISDISRGGSLTWPPQKTGVQYQLDTIQAMGLQVELLYQNGYDNAWSWSDSALQRMAALVTRSGAAGGTGWNQTSTSRQMPWLLNKRYGTSIPTQPSEMGRGIGFTDWLYGNGGGPAPKPTKAPKPTAKPKPKPTATPVPAPPGGGSTPVVNAPNVRLVKKTTTPTAGVPAIVSWSLAGSKSGLRRYELQYRRDGGAYQKLNLRAAGARTRWVTLKSGHTYTFRVRAVDKAGRIGAWQTVGPRKGQNVSDASGSITWKGQWKAVKLKTYLGGALHWTKTKGATATLRFKGTSVAWVGPIGSTRGKAQVYLDGKLMATVDLKAAQFHPRRIVFAASVKNGSHTLVIKALGTAGRPTVAIDALYIVAPS